jgi:methylated-DNA-[protein]-cysteine S-methyltransferase
MDSDDVCYTLFNTRWGHFGFVCRGASVCRTLLPVPGRTAARRALLSGAEIEPSEACFVKDLLSDLQERIVAYFEGENVDFSTDPQVDLTECPAFGRTILAACRQIPCGQTRTYTQLAASVGSRHAARAVGNTMARNPTPLIVPCHRVVRTDGGLGGFSAMGGTATKERMLAHERSMDRMSVL